jgi:hypothetical protein
MAPRIGVVVKTTPFRLDSANQALADLRAPRFDGARGSRDVNGGDHNNVTSAGCDAKERIVP